MADQNMDHQKDNELQNKPKIMGVQKENRATKTNGTSETEEKSDKTNGELAGERAKQYAHLIKDGGLLVDLDVLKNVKKKNHVYLCG